MIDNQHIGRQSICSISDEAHAHNNLIRKSLSLLKDISSDGQIAVVGPAALLILGHTVEVDTIDLLIDQSSIAYTDPQYWVDRLPSRRYTLDDNSLIRLWIKLKGGKRCVPVRNHMMRKGLAKFVTSFNNLPIVQPDMFLAMSLASCNHDFHGHKLYGSFLPVLTHEVTTQEICFLIDLLKKGRGLDYNLLEVCPVYPYKMWSAIKDLDPEYIILLNQIGGSKLLIPSPNPLEDISDYIYVKNYLETYKR